MRIMQPLTSCAVEKDAECFADLLIRAVITH